MGNFRFLRIRGVAIKWTPTTFTFGSSDVNFNPIYCATMPGGGTAVYT